MPKCVKCSEFFPPNYTEIVEDSQPDPLNNNQYPQHCIFCKLGIDKVERETSPNSGQYVFYSKAECIRDYKDFLGKVNESKNVQDILRRKEQGVKT